VNQKGNERFAQFATAFQELRDWCRERDYAGYDPFDALNSSIFSATPLAESPRARLIWTQLLKRSPVNLRPLLRVPPQRNPKGIALFALAALADYRRRQTRESEIEARQLLDLLIDLRITSFSGAAWGYNFAWQSRHFYAPIDSPAIVPTAFAARALIEAARVFADRDYLQLARSTCEFILHDLPLSEDDDGAVCFGYTPVGATRVLNASLLAAETLAGVAELTGESPLCDWAQRAARYIVRQQRPDGAWPYGVEATQSWVDNFHTAFVLYSLARITDACQLGSEYNSTLQLGYKFWRERFFLADGWPKYYDDRLYPADAHAAASAIVTLLEFQDSDKDAFGLAEKVARWSIEHLRDRAGFFYYQRRRWVTVRTPFMRWTQAWMLYALGRLLEEENTNVRRGVNQCQ
jgi:hypothetical protein